MSDLKNIDATDWTGPQTILLQSMLRFNEIYGGDNKKIQEAIDAYDPKENGGRFDIPVYNGIVNTAQPAKNALRFRVWFKGANGSQCTEHATMEEAIEEHHRLDNLGHLRVDWPCGVGWDNAMGTFVEFQVIELLAEKTKELT